MTRSLQWLQPHRLRDTLREGIPGLSKCCPHSHPASSTPSGQARQRLNPPLSYLPGGWSGAMSLPTASRSLFLSGGHRGTPGGWRPHAHELLLQMLQPRRSRQPTPGAAPVQLLAWHSHRMGLTPWHGWTHGCHCWSPNMEPLPLACSSKCHIRLLAAAFGGELLYNIITGSHHRALGPTATRCNAQGAGPHRLVPFSTPDPLSYIPDTASCIPRTTLLYPRAQGQSNLRRFRMQQEARRLQTITG